MSFTDVDLNIYAPPPFEEEGVYCYAHVGLSVDTSKARQILSNQ